MHTELPMCARKHLAVALALMCILTAEFRAKGRPLFHATNFFDPRVNDSRTRALERCFAAKSCPFINPCPSFLNSQGPLPAHLAPDVLSATTAGPKSSEWQNAKSQVTFTWKRLALNSCSPLITLPASVASCLCRINGLSIPLSHDFD